MPARARAATASAVVRCARRAWAARRRALLITSSTAARESCDRCAVVRRATQRTAATHWLGSQWVTRAAGLLAAVAAHSSTRARQDLNPDLSRPSSVQYSRLGVFNRIELAACKVLAKSRRAKKRPPTDSRARRTPSCLGVINDCPRTAGLSSAAARSGWVKGLLWPPAAL